MKRFKISGCALPPVMFTKFSTSIRWDVLAFACLASASRFARLACTICTATTRIPRHSGTEHRTHGKCECQIVPGSKYCHWHKPTWNQLKSFTCVSQDWVACCNKIPCEVKKKKHQLIHWVDSNSKPSKSSSNHSCHWLSLVWPLAICLLNWIEEEHLGIDRTVEIVVSYALVESSHFLPKSVLPLYWSPR